MYSEIADFIRRLKSVVYHVISRVKADKSLDLKPRTARPLMTTKGEDLMIVKMSLKDRFDTTTSISRAFYERTEKPISRKTVSRRLNKEKLVALIPYRKPLISELIEKFVLISPQSISCGQRSSGICFTLVMTLNSTCLDLMVKVCKT